MTESPESRLLDDLLAQVNLRARIAFRGVLCERWAIAGSQQGRLGFHVVLSGSCWLRVPEGGAPVELTAGGLLIYRPRARHLLADTPFADRESPPARIASVKSAIDGPHAGMLCGYFEGADGDIPVVDAVPACLIWPNFEAFPDSLSRLMRTIVACSLDEARCGERVLKSLCELMMLMVLREPGALRFDHIGILRAQRDPALRKVFNVIYAQPGKRWTLASLARAAGMSRSAFALRFKQQAEISAMRYLRRYRLAMADRRMREEGLSITKAARAAGYRSAGTLRRAARQRGG